MSNEAIGTPKAQYARGDVSGPFRCDNCVHYRWGNCNHPDTIDDAEHGYGGLKINAKNGMAIVKANDCCKYFR